MPATLSRRWPILVALAFPSPSWSQEPPQPPRPAKARVDLYGDPLPHGAIARLGTIRFRHPGAVHAVAFSADGKFLAASSDGQNMVIVWDRATGHKLREMPVSDRGLPPDQLRFSPDGKRLYGALQVWNAETGADARGVPHLPSESRVLAYSPDAREVLLVRARRRSCAGTSTKVRNWAVIPSRERDTLAPPLRWASVYSCRISTANRSSCGM